MANNDEEQNKIEQAKQTVEQVKEASKLAANAASGNVLGAAKSAIKLLKDKNFKKKLKRKLIMIALQAMVPIIIAAFLLGAINAIKDEMIDLLANAGTSVGGFLSRAWQWFTNDYWIKLDEGTEYFIDADTGETLGTKDTITDADLLNEKGETRNTATKVETIVDQYVRDLGNQGVSLQSLRLLGDADYSDTDKLLENEENKALVEKYIAEFIRADVITQQPHRRRGEGELVNQNNQNWVDGGIYIYRTKKEPTIDEDQLINGEYHEDDIEVEDQDYIQMTYMKYDEFQETLQKVNQNNIYNYNEERSLIKTLREHFTIDSNTGELVIAKIKSTITKESEVRIDENTSLLGKWFDKISEWWQSATSTKEVYEITEERLDYKQLISKYTMPYEFLIQLCEITQNPEFVYHVALLARNTKIVLVVQDNITIERETNEKEQDIKRYENSTSNSRVDASITDEYTKQIRKVTITTTQTPVLKVKSADTWSFYEEFKYTKNVNATKTEEGPRTTLWSIPNVLSHEESSKQVTGYRGDGSTYLIDYPGYWWDEFVTQERTATQTVTSETTYNEPICENPIEKSKQFLGLLRNNTGTCPYNNCFEENKNPTKGDPIALYCAQEAVFERNGTNVQYRIPNMTRMESPLNRLTSGIEMLYAVLQSNSSGYEEKDLMLSTEQIGESFDIQNQYIADGDYESAYIVKMQGLVEHLRYLMTFPENENYTPVYIHTSDDDEDNYDIRVEYDDITDEELNILYKVCEAEAGGSTEPEIGHVASVVLNRVKCSKWPNTIREVVFQPAQFSCITDGHYDKAVPSDKTKRAVDSVLANGDTTGGAVYYRTEKSAKKAGMPTSKNETHPTYIFLFKDPNTHIFYTDKLSLQELIGSTGGSVPATGKLKDIFPDGVPTTQNEIRKYLITIEVPITTKSGAKTTTKVTVHKAIAEDLKQVLQKAQDAGFKVYEVQGFSWRNISGKSTISQHALGLAVDINVNENYCVYPNGKVDAGSFWDPAKSEYSIPKNGTLVNAFKSIGWGWGGNWSSKKDYMHFSYTGG